MIRTYKRKLILSKEQENRLNSWLGTCRLVYNMALEIKIDSYKKTGKSPSNFDLNKQLTEIRAEHSWIADVPGQTIQEPTARLQKAFQNFFRNLKKGGGFPKFASKKRWNSLYFPSSISIKENFVKLPKIGLLKIFKDSAILGKPKTATIVKETTGFFVCIQCSDVPQKYHSESQAVGIDVGISNFASFDDGSFVANPKHFGKYEKTMRIFQRKLSRQKKFGNNWKKTKAKLSKLHHKIANVRQDFLHKESTKIAKKYATVYLEDLQINNISKSAKGTLEDPGKNIKQKSGLNKSILDAGWGMFRTMLTYKTNVVLVSAKHTSQICSACGYKDKENRKKQAFFKCLECGKEMHADTNAAKNIRGRGTAIVRESEATACA